MISEVDINDMRELFNLHHGDKFKLAGDDDVVPQVFTLEKIDGMYSRCFGADGTLYHFAAWTKVVPWKS